MYREKFDFFIVSNNLQIEKVLRKVKPLEDCEYLFSTYPDLSVMAKEQMKKSTAVIIDSGSEQPAGAIEDWIQQVREEKDMLQTVIILPPGQPVLAVSCFCEIDHIWLVEAENDTETMRRYFEKLVSVMKEKADARKQEICFQTLIDSSKDLIWFKDTEGKHLIVNDEFCRFVNKSKDQIYKQGHCYIWNASKEDEKVCLESDQQIMLERVTQKFEEQVHSNGEDYIIQSYKSPLTEQGEIFGTCGIGQNITNERNLEKKLQMILDHLPFAVAVASKEEILTYKNRLFDIYFPETVDFFGKSLSDLKECLHLPENVDEGETVELKIHLDDDQPVWLSYHERKILDAFDLQIEKMLVIQDITANKKLEKQKEQVACTDFLTGLSNRRGMLRSMANDISGLTVIMIDIDDFKSINDSFGHRIGDEVLKEVATAIKKVFLADVLVRYGGDEFLIITRLHERDVIGAKIEKLMSRLKEITYGNEESRKRGVSISAGVSAKAKTGRHTIENLIEMSDEAMYHIKKHGKQGYSFYDERTKDK